VTKARVRSLLAVSLSRLRERVGERVLPTRRQVECYSWRMPTRAGDWIAQAERDLRVAQRNREAGEHEWACFAAQQAAEKAVKALHLGLGQEAWGHVVARLLRELPIEVPPELVEKARVLDNFYVPTRYPNGHPEGAPFEHYGPLQSEEARRYAGEIVTFARARLASTG